MPPLRSSDSTDRRPREGSPTFHSSHAAAAELFPFSRLDMVIQTFMLKGIAYIKCFKLPWGMKWNIWLGRPYFRITLVNGVNQEDLFFFFSTLSTESNRVIVLTSTTCATSITFAKSEFIPLCQIPLMSINYSKHIKVTIPQKGDMFLVNPHLKIVPNGKHFGKKEVS